jgi:hypothetical protein
MREKQIFMSIFPLLQYFCLKKQCKCEDLLLWMLLKVTHFQYSASLKDEAADYYFIMAATNDVFSRHS